MKILIIYENIPESTDLYVLEVTDEEWKWISLTHGHFINYGEIPEAAANACDKLTNWLVGRGKFQSNGPVNVDAFGISYVVLTGFGM